MTKYSPVELLSQFGTSLLFHAQFCYFLTCIQLSQEAGKVDTHGTMDWLKTGKGVHQGCILSLCLFNFYAEYIMWNAGLNEAQAGIKIAGRNINNLMYADDTTSVAESEELKCLLMSLKKESEKAGLKLNIQKMKIMASSLITSWQIRWGKSGNNGWSYFLWL